MDFTKLILNIILTLIYDSLVALLLVHFFLSLFRIRDSNMRILFFFLPLVKPFFVITEKVSLNRDMLSDGVLHIGFRLPNPNNIFRIKESFSGPISFSETNVTILVVISSLFIAAISLRWVHLALFYKSLSHEEVVGKKELPILMKIIEQFAKRLGIKPPAVSLTHRRYFSPFLIGIGNKTLVISPNLLDVLTYSEKETLISHELSHIKRRDNIISWTALVMRDLMIFNPFAHIAYYLVRSEQERAADSLVVYYSYRDKKDIAKDILNSIMKYKDLLSCKRPPEPSSSFSPLKLIGNRKLHNRIDSILSLDKDRMNIRLLPRILMYLLFLILFIFQIVLFVRIGDIILFLR